MANIVNPYNFVPLEHAPSRTALDAYYTGKLLTGRLDYTLTTDTPLLIPDSAKVVKDEKIDHEKIDHKRYPFFRLPDGTPAIPGSEMRGAMRAVYEAVTNSCLSVLLDSTEEPFSQRLPSTNGFKDHGLLGIDPETGKWVLYAADVVDYLKLSEGRDGSLMCNGWLNWYGHEYHSGQHTRLRPDGPSGWLQFNRPITLYKKNYHVRLLAPKAGRPVIFRWQDDTPYRALSNILKKSADNDPRSAAHGDLLAALKRVHDNDPKQGGLVPVWYLLADDNGTLRCYLSGASIGRVMQGRSWTEIMGNYAPCADTDALCPGCALFGTVKGKGTSGRVRFTDAEAAQYESLGNKTLPILSGPKPSAYEFYLEKPKSTYETSIGFWNYDFCSLEETKCSPDGTKQTIKKFRVYTPQPRGRKFYWHSAPRTENERSNQNATLEAMKGTFKGSVYFERTAGGTGLCADAGREHARQPPPAQNRPRQAGGLRQLQNHPDRRRAAHPGAAGRHALLHHRAAPLRFPVGRPWAHRHRQHVRKEPFENCGQAQHPEQDCGISECQRQKRQRQDFQLVLPEPQARKEPCYAAAPAGQQHYAGAEARP